MVLAVNTYLEFVCAITKFLFMKVISVTKFCAEDDYPFYYNMCCQRNAVFATHKGAAGASVIFVIKCSLSFKAKSCLSLAFEESDSNFIRLIYLYSVDSPKLVY